MAAQPESAESRRYQSVADRFLGLLTVLDKLRSPDGCEWDKAQSSKSLIPYLLEETYEVIEAIEDGNIAELKEELGDLLLHILFQNKIAEEEQQFSLEECIEAVTTKLIERHPHVFKGKSPGTTAAAPLGWEAAKQVEKQRTSRLAGIPRDLPALTRAQRIQEKAAGVGFDWKEIEPILGKVEEEMAEFHIALEHDDADALEEELGDILFSVVNLARFLNISSETALRRTIAKFEYRFKGIETELQKVGKTPESASLEEMDTIWNRYRQNADKNLD